MYPSKFISIEGIEGVGKSSALSYIQSCLKEHNIEHINTREPGGTEIAEAIRSILLNKYEESMLPDTELLLMYASRLQHYHSKIKPVLDSGKWVISDRFNDASFAYQGGGRGIEYDRVSALNDWVLKGIKPDLTFLLDAPIEVTASRIATRGEPDRIESEKNEFFNDVRTTYLKRAHAEPDRFIIIDASLSIEEVKISILRELNSYIQKCTDED